MTYEEEIKKVIHANFDYSLEIVPDSQVDEYRDALEKVMEATAAIAIKVFLKNLWHDPTEEPTKDDLVLQYTKDDNSEYIVPIAWVRNCREIISKIQKNNEKRNEPIPSEEEIREGLHNNWLSRKGRIKWCYLSDIIPKKD